MTSRERNGQFRAGRSGNPRGRPSADTMTIRKQLTKNHEDIIEVIRQAALGGDMQASKMILDRICPPLKAQSVPVAVTLPLEGDMTQIAKELIKAGAEGRLSPDVAAQMVSAVAQFARITEIKGKLPEPESEDSIITKVEIHVVRPDGEITVLDR